MSLSNTERYDGICWAIKHLTEHGRNLKIDENFQYIKLYELTQQLWATFLNNECDSSHYWLLGSDSSNDIGWESLSPWACNIRYHCGKLKDNISYHDEPYNAKNMLQVPNFLYQIQSHNNYNLQQIFEIYRWCEQTIYYLRRYNDKVLKDLQLLNNLISSIMGECFSLFDENFTKAYMLQKICEKLLCDNNYPYNSEKWTVFFKWFNEQTIHHDITRAIQDPIEIVSEYFKQVFNEEKNLTEYDKILLCMKMAGRRYHYEYKWKKLKSLVIKQFNKYQIIELKKQFNQNVINYNKDKKEEYERFWKERCKKMNSIF